MKSIKEFARRPELIEVQLNSQEIIELYGEPITFWMKDFIDINSYFDFFHSQQTRDENLNIVLRKIILNEQGQPIIGEDEFLPVNLAVAALTKISEILGKSKTKPLMSEIGNQPA